MDTQGSRPCDVGGRDWNDASISQGTPKIAGVTEEASKVFP